MLLRQLFSVVGCDDSPAAAPLPQIDDAPAMLPLDLNAFYVDKELLQRKGYRTVRDLYNDGVRNQEDLRSLCLKLRDERKKEEQLRNFSDMVRLFGCGLFRSTPHKPFPSRFAAIVPRQRALPLLLPLLC